MTGKTRPVFIGGIILLVAMASIVIAGAFSNKPTWKIGLEAPLSGSQSSIGQGMLKGAQLAATEVNAAGGLNGRDIEIVQIDDKADPAAGVAAANTAIASHLDGIVGPYNSGVGTKTLPLYMKAGLVPVRLTSASVTEGMGITLQPMESQIAPVAVSSLSGARSVAIAYDPTSDYTKGVASNVRAQLTAAGVTVTSYLEVQPGKKSYDDVLTTLKTGSPDAIYAAVYYPEGALFAKGLAAGGTSPKCLLDYASYDSGYVTSAGTSASRCTVVGVPAPTDFAGAASHVADYKSAFGQNPGTWSPYTYDSVNLLVSTARENGGFAAKGLERRFGDVRNFQGWTGDLAIALPTGNREPATVVLTEVSNGQLHEVGGAEVSGPAEEQLITTELTSQVAFIHQVGTATSYGFNDLVGTSSDGTKVEMLGNVNYVSGSGRFFGSITFTYANGDVLGFGMDGQAVKQANGSTKVSAPLTVIGGTGRYLKVTGTGTFAGSRTGEVGAPVKSVFSLEIRGVATK